MSEYTITKESTTKFKGESGLKMFVFEKDGEVTRIGFFFDVYTTITLDCTTKESQEKSGHFLCDLSNFIEELDNFTEKKGV